MRSIGARLALWYASVSTATLVLLFVAGYYLLQQHLVRGLDTLNRAEFEQIKSSLGPDYAKLSRAEVEERMRGVAELASVLFYVEIHAKDKSLLFASPNLGPRRLQDVPGEHEFAGNLEGLGAVRIGEFFLGPMDILVATSADQVRQVMNGYAEISLILVCLMLVLSLITGLVLSRAALSPVRAIQETAHRIRSDNLSERIPVGEVQDEISNLARLLNEMFDRLEISFNQIRRFTAEASHELKTPLSLVRLQAEKLLVEGGLTPAQEEAVQVQLEEIARLNKIIEELLFLSRAEARAVRLDFRREDPRAFLQSFAQDARVLAEHRGVDFALQLEGDGLVEFDPSWLRQVLFNLVQNALNVSPTGGSIQLVSDFTVESWRVALEDEGPGVAPEQRERIFDRFVRLETDEKPAAAKGSGLGQAISRSIVGLHGGTIRAEAGASGRGLRIVFELPVLERRVGDGARAGA
ncbi:MAG: HAMP domain-containing protein [Candidatus Didemnitutus sp.]|nr:HAMP domain-containing protein [Candidatus Didemnitutus sp.]